MVVFATLFSWVTFSYSEAASDGIHLSLLLGESGKICLEFLDLLLPLCRGGCGLINLGRDLAEIALKVRFLCLGLGHLLITVRLLGGILLGLLFQLGDHVTDQALDLTKHILTVASSVFDHG